MLLGSSPRTGVSFFPPPVSRYDVEEKAADQQEFRLAQGKHSSVSPRRHRWVCSFNDVSITGKGICLGSERMQIAKLQCVFGSLYYWSRGFWNYYRNNIRLRLDIDRSSHIFFSYNLNDTKQFRVIWWLSNPMLYHITALEVSDTPLFTGYKCVFHRLLVRKTQGLNLIELFFLFYCFKGRFGITRV